MKAKRPVILLILDGWGINQNKKDNAICEAKTPNMDHILATYPHSPIGAAGEYIGLEAGHQGSTEMGHLIISAGRNVLLAQMQIQEAIRSNTIQTNPVYLGAIQHAKQNGTRVHLMGLLSNAGVHSYDETLHKLLDICRDEGLEKEQVFIHVFSDGRDTPPTSLAHYVRKLQKDMGDDQVGVIASLMGRYWAMDRDQRWGRIEKAYNLLVNGIADRTARSIEDAMEQAYAASETDEFISPTSIHPEGVFRDGDAVINFNYRVDREIEITQALIEPDFAKFDRGTPPKIHYVATLPYYSGMNAPSAFEREELKMKNILPAVLSDAGYSQYRLAETEKWAYVTKIFNAMHEEPFAGEERKLIPSDKIETFDLKPEMQAIPIAKDLVIELDKGEQDTYIVNICNADMLGHTGNHDATIKGIEVIDKALGLILSAVKQNNAILMITADHGNAERMMDYHNEAPHTQHTDALVPFILVDQERTSSHIRETGSLKDIAPTILDVMGIPQPDDMTGTSLITN